MKYNEIGKTGLKVSNLSFGASSLGGVFHNIREAEGIEAVFTAIDKVHAFLDGGEYRFNPFGLADVVKYTA